MSSLFLFHPSANAFLHSNKLSTYITKPVNRYVKAILQEECVTTSSKIAPAAAEWPVLECEASVMLIRLVVLVLVLEWSVASRDAILVVIVRGRIKG